MKQIIFLFLFFCMGSVFSQKKKHKSIMQEESEFYSSFKLKNENQFDSLRQATNPVSNSRFSNSPTCTLNKKVFGWHPYWNGNTYQNYQWNLLSDLCYFDYSVSASTGSNTNGSFAWTTSSAVTVAQSNGVKVHICATLFSSHATFWNSVSAQNAFITNIVSLLNARGGNGVNIDFEGMGASDKIPFTNFITSLNAALNAANPNYQLSVCLYAVEWSSVFDIPNLVNQVDFFTVMGYDYYYSGSAQAGPTSPLYNFQTSYNYTISKSLTYYLKQGVPANKLLLGLPYYGREWEVSANIVPANTTGNFNSSRTLSYINNSPATYTTSNKFWEGNCYSPYYTYLSGGNYRQCFIDDVYSLGRKYDMVNQRGIAGIGIWALGYDDGMTAYWDLIRDKFSNCAPIICSDSLFDMGGPTRNYYDNENYTYIISAPTGSLVHLAFQSFGTELNYDSLWLYNGTSTLSPLIGAYTGTNSPGNITSSGQTLTLRFKSDGATVSWGFRAIKTCSPQVLTALSNLQTNNEELRIWPNPFNTKVHIQGQSILKISVLDAAGKLIFSGGDNSETVIDFKEMGLSAGLYFISVQTSSGSIVKKIIYSD